MSACLICGLSLDRHYDPIWCPDQLSKQVIDDPKFIVTRWRYHSPYLIEYDRLEEAAQEFEWDDQVCEKIEFEGHVLVTNEEHRTLGYNVDKTVAIARERMWANQSPPPALPREPQW